MPQIMSAKRDGHLVPKVLRAPADSATKESRRAAVSTKISGTDVAQIASVGAGLAVQRPKDATGGTTQRPATKETDDVQITGTARQLSTLEQAIRDVPVVNEARVSQLRTAIEQGTYTVNPDHIADRFLQLEGALEHLPHSGGSDSGSSHQSGS
jgi:negative regulator of flagellin synthesis FlgM